MKTKDIDTKQVAILFNNNLLRELDNILYFSKEKIIRKHIPEA